MKIKQYNMILLIAVLLMVQICFAGNDLIIMKTDGTVLREAISGIDSVIFQETGTLTDIDGKIYKTVKIGDQWWMAENLRTTRYSDFTTISKVEDNTEWTELSTGAYCYYNNDISNSQTYGMLYNWYAVHDARNIAPEGWHVPTNADWTTLVNYLGGLSIAGGKLKEIGTINWEWPNTGATNESGFTALPSGFRTEWAGNFIDMGVNTFFWSVTESNNTDAWKCYIRNDRNSISLSSDIKRFGYSVRCVKDATP